MPIRPPIMGCRFASANLFEVGREGWQVGCDDHPMPLPFKSLQDDPTNATSDGNDTAGRCPISSFGSIFPTPQSCRRD